MVNKLGAVVLGAAGAIALSAALNTSIPPPKNAIEQAQIVHLESNVQHIVSDYQKHIKEGNYGQARLDGMHAQTALRGLGATDLAEALDAQQEAIMQLAQLQQLTQQTVRNHNSRSELIDEPDMRRIEELGRAITDYANNVRKWPLDERKALESALFAQTGAVLAIAQKGYDWAQKRPVAESRFGIDPRSPYINLFQDFRLARSRLAH